MTEEQLKEIEDDLKEKILEMEWDTNDILSMEELVELIADFRFVQNELTQLDTVMTLAKDLLAELRRVQKKNVILWEILDMMKHKVEHYDPEGLKKQIEEALK